MRATRTKPDGWRPRRTGSVLKAAGGITAGSTHPRSAWPWPGTRPTDLPNSPQPTSTGSGSRFPPSWTRLPRSAIASASRQKRRTGCSRAPSPSRSRSAPAATMFSSNRRWSDSRPWTSPGTQSKPDTCCESAGPQFWFLRVVRAGNPGAGADADGIPGVDGHDEADQRGDLLRAELGRHVLVRLVGDVRIGQARDRLGERQRGALARGEVRGLRPGRQPIDALFGLADRARVLGVHVDAVGAAVELRGADPDQFAELGVDLGLVEFLGRGLVQVRHRPGVAGREGVEGQPDGDLRSVVRDRHGTDAMTPNGPR